MCVSVRRHPASADRKRDARHDPVSASGTHIGQEAKLAVKAVTSHERE